MPARARSSREYSSEHRKERARLLPYALGTMCPCGVSGHCTHRCDGIMTNPARMDLDHTLAIVLGGSKAGDTITCSPCNRSSGATLGNRLRGRRVASRDW